MLRIERVDVIDAMDIDTIIALETQREFKIIRDRIFDQLVKYQDLGKDYLSLLDEEGKGIVLDDIWDHIINQKSYFALTNQDYAEPLYYFMVVDNFRYFVPQLLEDTDFFNLNVLPKLYKKYCTEMKRRLVELTKMVQSPESKDRLIKIVKNLDIYVKIAEAMNEEYIEWLYNAISANYEDITLKIEGNTVKVVH